MKLTDNAKKITDELINRFRSGDIAPIVEVAMLRLSPAEIGRPSQKWSFSNQVLALMQTGELDCRGFNQWHEVGRSVKKGSHAAYILGPIIIKDKNEKTGKETAALVGFKSIPVFPLHETDGAELPEPKEINRPLPLLAEVAQAWGIKILWVESRHYYGSFSQESGTIALATESQKTFFHELAHAAHARIEGKLKNGQDPRQELIADFCAAVLMQTYGLKDMSGNVWEYIKGYNPNDPIKAIMAALDTIGKVIDLILTTAADLELSKETQ